MAIVPRTAMPEHALRPAGNIARSAGIVVGGLLLLWVTLGVTVTQVMTGDVTAFWPFAAEPRAQAASRKLVDDQGPASLRHVRTIALRALLREPINVVAARVAGLAAGVSGDAIASRRLLLYAQGLSRRDLSTQAALIEFSVAKGDVTQALHHYDLALRTGDAADQLLMPVLVVAARDPAIAAPLATMLARRPPWRMRFVYNLLVKRPWPVTFMPLLLAARLDIRDPLERDFLIRASRGLVADNAISAAAGLYRTATGTAIVPGVRNGDFSHEDRLPPFDWQITDEPGLSGVTGPVDAPIRSALSINVDAGRSGTVARQLLIMPAGRYRLHFKMGGVDAAHVRSNVSLTCNDAEQPFALVRLSTATSSVQTIDAHIDVPSSCGAQWLAINGDTDLNEPATQVPWISDVAIVRP